MAYVIKEINGIKVVTIEEFEETDMVKHGFSTRVGGYSQEAFKALNLGLKTKDDRERVLKNLEVFCSAINICFQDLVLGDQTHEDGIRIVTKEDKGKGILYKKDYSGIDGLITKETAVPLMTFHADCVPLLFLDPVNKAVAASHAGWKGTLLKIGQKTVLNMMKKFHSQPKNIMVGIGPSIGKCCYEVSKDVVENFNTNFTETSNLVFSTGKDKFMLDLWEANRIALEEVGILDKNIIISDLCTACDEDLFYSHRREKGLTGRMASVIELK